MDNHYFPIISIFKIVIYYFSIVFTTNMFIVEFSKCTKCLVYVKKDAYSYAIILIFATLFDKFKDPFMFTYLKLFSSLQLHLPSSLDKFCGITKVIWVLFS